MEFPLGGGEGGFDRGYFAEPALLFGLGEPVDEVGVDLFQSWLLNWVNAEEGDLTQAFSRAHGVPKPRPRTPSATFRSSKWAKNSSHSPAVGPAGAFGSAAGDEGTMMGDEGTMVGDDVVGVDRGVAHRGVERACP
ncbi:hypothetical protein HII36_37630 [Nonomuraea sp. NN258]|uniref:hypothetical protein n=1 Tax=Nonomuraea antri TaxID=2730852 RepID=UPI001567E19C|nr:hypothetical protein [Nonomuraea antri]NRQ37512.1 hypothetical protein [Nonomuraea antri]